MATWGVLRLAAETTRSPGAIAPDIAQHLDGLVPVSERAPLGGLLARLPADVRRIVVLDATAATDPGAGGALARLLAADDGSDAVVTLVPLADALKRVEDEVVVEGIAREGMWMPADPLLLDRSVLDRLAAEGSDVPLAVAASVVGRLLDEGRPVWAVDPDGMARALGVTAVAP